MSDYAIALQFDTQTQHTLQAMIDKIADATGVGYMQSAHVPPHLTLSMVLGKNEQEILHQVEKAAVMLPSEKLYFAFIGAFTPFSIFTAPVMNEFLLNANSALNEAIQKVATAGNRGLYLPNNWVPHIALAVKLTNNTLKKAFAVVQELFKPFTAKAERLIFAKCEPYTELKTWELKNGL